MWRAFLVSALLVSVVAIAATGCLSKAKAKEQARAAFFAGQRDATERMRLAQLQGTNVIFSGAVRNTFVPWTPELTLARALVTADYLGPKDPSGIVIRREGKEIPVSPQKLLEGEDVPLQPHDIIELKP